MIYILNYDRNFENTNIKNKFPKFRKFLPTTNVARRNKKFKLDKYFNRFTKDGLRYINLCLKISIEIADQDKIQQESRASTSVPVVPIRH